MSSSPKVTVVVVARHGERTDYACRDAGKNWVAEHAKKQPWNPPLTAHGKEQAALLGAELTKQLSQLGLPSVSTVCSSPLLRCQQTAACTSLGPVHVEEALMESIVKQWYQSWALPESNGTWGGGPKVEFCGGSHMENTKEAESFVILEETAVAKGIRRISAVTKSSAVEAKQNGASFMLKVEEGENLIDDTEDLDKIAGSLRKELDAAYISAPLKSTLRVRIEGIQKRAGDAKKKVLQRRLDLCIEELKTTVNAAVEKGERTLVLPVDIGADSKSAQKVSNTIKSLAPDMGFLGLSEEEPGSGGKLMAFASVPDSIVGEGLKADEWVRACLESCGGRGGGKPGNAQGQAKQCDDVEAVVKAARDFVDGRVKAHSAA